MMQKGFGRCVQTLSAKSGKYFLTFPAAHDLRHFILARQFQLLHFSPLEFFFGAECPSLIQQRQFPFEEHVFLVKPAITRAFIAEPPDQPKILFFHQTPPRKGLTKSDEPVSK